jgi:hypothetical protein
MMGRDPELPPRGLPRRATVVDLLPLYRRLDWRPLVVNGADAGPERDRHRIAAQASARAVMREWTGLPTFVIQAWLICSLVAWRARAAGPPRPLPPGPDG